MRRLAVGVAAAAIAWAGAARADGRLGADGAPIRTSEYGVDLAQTPILGSARVVGLAGALVALAEGTDGSVQSPAAPAVRPPYSVDHFDWDWGLGFTLPASLTSTDFFNTGRGRTQLSDAEQGGFVFVTPAISLMWGPVGVGATFELANYSLRRSTDQAEDARRDELAARFNVAHLQAAHAFSHGQLVVGGGARILSLTVQNTTAPSGQANLFTTVGAGAEVGAIWMPTGEPYRVGASLRTPVTTSPDPTSKVAADTAGDRVIGDPADPLNAFWLPKRAEQPWDLNVGAAVQLGPRPLNPGWEDPDLRTNAARLELVRRSQERKVRREIALRKLERERGGASPEAARAVDAELESEQALDELELKRIRAETRRELSMRHATLARRYVLITTSLVVTGAVKEAVGVESFLQRVVARSGGRVVLSPRLGVEAELIPSWLRLRAGSYSEPTRFATSRARIHGTGGFDFRLFDWSLFGILDDGSTWRLSVSADASRRYLGWAVSIGLFH